MSGVLSTRECCLHNRLHSSEKCHQQEEKGQIETKVYVKPTSSSLLLHYQSHVDNRYKQGLLRSMLDGAYRLSSCWSHFQDECSRLKTAFPSLKYPKHFVNSTIKSFVDSKVCDKQRPLSPSK